MEFGLSELQIALQENLGKFLDEHCDLDKVRSFASNPKDVSDELWQGLSSLGIPGAMIADDYGGSGLGALDAVALSECIGANVAPVPFLSTAVVAPTVLQKLGSDEIKTEYLADIAAGNVRFGLALSELTGSRQDAGVSSQNGTLNGQSNFVTDPDADRFIVATKTGKLFVADPRSSGIEFSEMPNVDRTRQLVSISFDNAPAQPLGDEESADEIASIVDLARVVLAADTLGAAQTMLDKSVEYAKERRQFNRVIASFQAVKHMCAEMAAEIEPARSLVWYAGHALDEQLPDARLTACHAKSHLSEVGTFVARTATIVHGGMGFTDLLGLHYWFKRIGFNRQVFGGPERLRDEAAQLQGLA